MTQNYSDFLAEKSRAMDGSGFDPVDLASFLFPFQRDLVTWAVRRGRAALFADCGLGKTPMQLEWARQVANHTTSRVLVLAPHAVGPQTVGEGKKFDIQCDLSRDGRLGKHPITVTNYERLHYFNPSDFGGVVCDESSILKHFGGATQQAVTTFMHRIPYRLLCTATAAPNDYVELGTSSEALGELGQVDMLSRFFKQDPQIHKLNERKQRTEGKLDRRLVVAGTGSSWRLKGHAIEPFWRWVASWARACRSPQDVGYSDDRFTLPPLDVRHHSVEAATIEPGMLFALPATNFREERAERRRSITERCQQSADLVNVHKEPAVVWCHLNDEGDLLEKLIPDATQVKGAMTDEAKERAYAAFESGERRVLVVKPKIGAWGLNWQHCAHVVTFVSHSYEQYYQSVRRCWRFGQERPVVVDVVASKGEERVRDSIERKATAASEMFDNLVEYMNTAQDRAKATTPPRQTLEVPAWM